VSVCAYHGDRPGVGVCMRCKAVICAACCTRLDGINHCHACLKVLANRREKPRRGEFPPTLAAALLLAGSWLALFGLCWLGQGILDR
jgi:hypothetical protein